MGSIIISKILLLFLFLGLIFLGMDIDERYKKNQTIQHIFPDYMVGTAIVCGIIIGIASSVLSTKL